MTCSFPLHGPVARPRGAPRRPGFVFGLVLLLLSVAALPRLARADDAAAVEKRLGEAARYLASDELEGRGVGTGGIDLAADYIAEQFAELGLKTDLFDAAPMQKFALTTSAEMGSSNTLTLVGPPERDGELPQRLELKLGDDFSPMATSGSAEFDLPLVFVGYGITGKEEGYDDYAGVDVQGKMVVVLRHEPQQANPHSAFNGAKDSSHAPFRRKISNAFEHGAAGVIFCTDQFDVNKMVALRRKQWRQALDRLAAEHEKSKKVENPTFEQIEAQRESIDKLLSQVEAGSEKLRDAFDPVIKFGSASGGDPRPDFVVVHCRREALDGMVASALGKGLKELESQIDDGPTPHSGPLTGWRAVGQTDVERKQVEVKNVVGVLEATGPLAEETLVIGAHYDHLGFGRSGSSKDGKREVYNGADDNASGVAAVIEIARSLANREEKLRRRVVFMAFTAEERGLLGSAHYVNHPLVPLQKTVAMLNLDMVGRLREDKLIVTGTATAKQFDGLLDRINQQHGLKISKKPSGFGASDHASFYGKQIPAMHFYTGVHSDYHRPSDDFEKLNIAGMRRVTALVTDVAVALADAEDRPEYVSTKRPASTRRSGDRPYLGTIPDFAAEGPGYALSGVTDGGPADKAGLKAGDAIIRFGQSKIGNLEDIDGALRKHKAGDRVKVVVRRGEKEITVEVQLDPPR